MIRFVENIWFIVWSQILYQSIYCFSWYQHSVSYNSMLQFSRTCIIYCSKEFFITCMVCIKNKILDFVHIKISTKNIHYLKTSTSRDVNYKRLNQFLTKEILTEGLQHCRGWITCRASRCSRSSGWFRVWRGWQLEHPR